MSAVENFVLGLTGLAFPDVFNPYTDHCAAHDLPDAPDIRRRNLTQVLEAAVETTVDDLWIGLELGHKGGRRTGLAMTDERHLEAHGARFGVATLERATKSGPEREITGGIIWGALNQITRPVYLWNVVPVHPHLHGQPLSNRRHTRAEREACLPLLTQLIGIIRPKRLVAVGKDAAAALQSTGYPHLTARHPAYGGKQSFLDLVLGTT